MATSIFFQGRTISTPGSYTSIDASGMEVAGLGSIGTVAILGEAVGGRPASTMTKPGDFITMTTPAQARATFRSGPLREACAMVFAPSSDKFIVGGAQTVIAMKTNTATQSATTLSNAHGPVIDITSRDYGAHTEQIMVSLTAAPTGQTGLSVTVSQGDTTESAVALGGDDLGRISYQASGHTWADVSMQSYAGGVISAFGQARFDSTAADATGTWTASAVTATASGSDAGQFCTVYGTNADGRLISETIFLVAGAQPTTATFATVHGAKLARAAVADVTLSGGGATYMTIAAGQSAVGVLDAYAMFVTTDLTLTASAGSQTVHVHGVSSSGRPIAETVTVTTGGVQPSAQFAMVTAIGLADVAAGANIQLTAVVARTQPAVQETLRHAMQYFAGLSETGPDSAEVGFDFELLSTNADFNLSQLDVRQGIAAAGSASGLSFGLRGDTYAVINWLNNNSNLVSATLSTDAYISPPEVSARAYSLVGGQEGISSVQTYQQALALLEQTRVNTVVVLSGHEAVHLALNAHCEYMCGFGKNERDGLVGIVRIDAAGAPVGTGEVLASKAQILEQTARLNSRHIRACTQSVTRYDTTGEHTEFPPWYTAVIAAGMQAGSPVGTPLTFKYIDALDADQDVSWSPATDSEEMIQGGTLFLESVQGKGLRWVRNVTTYRRSDNLAFVEASMNECVNLAAYTLREAMEAAVGATNAQLSLGALRGIAVTTLGVLTSSGTLADWRGLSLTQTADHCRVLVQMAPPTMKNFVTTEMYLYTQNLAA